VRGPAEDPWEPTAEGEQAMTAPQHTPGAIDGRRDAG
jgi:hypothetical protein